MPFKAYAKFQGRHFAHIIALPVSMALPQLALAAEAAADDPDHILVVANRTQDPAPGATTLLSQTELENARVFNINEALRKVPGLVVRDEEGIGLRPNIGVRGVTTRK